MTASLTPQYIQIRNLKGLVAQELPMGGFGVRTHGGSFYFVKTFQAELLSKGYLLSRDLEDALSNLDTASVQEIAVSALKAVRELQGDNVRHRVMYPGFPDEVMEMDDVDLLSNAITHYMTFGTWLPTTNMPEEFRGWNPDDFEFTTLSLLDAEEYKNLFCQIAYSADSISETDANVLMYGLTNGDAPELDTTQIRHREIFARYVAHCLKNGQDINVEGATSVDVLRIATALSDGDVSLAENTRFKNQPKKVRRFLTRLLARVYREEDVLRHEEKFKRLAHNLHVGDYDRKLHQKLTALRDNSVSRQPTFNGQVEQGLKSGDFVDVSKLLDTRPGEFIRRLGELRDRNGSLLLPNGENIANVLESVIEKVSTRQLMQFMGYVRSRTDDQDQMFVIPSGPTARATIVSKKRDRWTHDECDQLLDVVATELTRRFAQHDRLGSVYVDPSMYNAPLPQAQRSASNSKVTVARGTRIPMDPSKNTVRFFIHWIGQDIDLSATFHGNDFDMRGQVSYTNLRSGNDSGKYMAVHSGDITYAPGPDGASEFIDIDLDQAKKLGHRYVVMNVRVYSGPTFANHKQAFAGFMMRSNPGSNEIYDPRTVSNKFDLESNAMTALPLVIDIVNREVIWMDIAAPANSVYSESCWGDTSIRIATSGNNVESNRASIRDQLKFFVQRNNRPTIGDLMSFHARARGQLVNDREQADFVVGWDGDLDPTRINVINSDFMVD